MWVTGMLLVFPDTVLTFMCKKAVLRSRSGLCYNKSIKIEQLLLLIYNFTYVVSVKYPTF